MRRRCTFLSSSRMLSLLFGPWDLMGDTMFSNAFSFCAFWNGSFIEFKGWATSYGSFRDNGNDWMNNSLDHTCILWWIDSVIYPNECIQNSVSLIFCRRPLPTFHSPFPLFLWRQCELSTIRDGKTKNTTEKNRGSENPGVPFCFPCLFCSKIVISYISTNMVCFVGTRELSWLERDANNAKWSDSPFIAQAD